LPQLPEPSGRDVVFRMSSLDCGGRNTARTAMGITRWSPGDRIRFSVRDGLIVAMVDPLGHRCRGRLDHADAAEGTAMTSNSDIQAALDNRDWSGAEAVTERPRAKIVHSVRLPVEWSEALEAEADQRGTTPSRR
jgi:hypothetical protein